MEKDSNLLEKRGSSVAIGLASGILAGLAGAWAMSEFQSIWSTLSDKLGQSRNNGSHDNERQSEQEQQDPATVQAAQRVSELLFHRELAETEKESAGQAAHYAMGAVSGGIYGVLSESMPTLSMGAGLPFGAAVWLIADNLAVPAFGLSRWPTEYPASIHAYALASHLVYGIVTDAVRRVARATLSSTQR